MTRVITDILPSEEDPNYRVVYVDGSPEITIPSSTALRLELDINQPWTQELATQLHSLTDMSLATSMALRLVSRKSWGMCELAARLVTRGIDPCIAELTTQQLNEDGWLNDFKYACARIRELTRNEPASKRWIQRKLQDRKLSPEIIAQAIDEEVGNRSEQDAATQLANIRLLKMKTQDEATVRRRVISALSRRGFSVDVGAEALRRAQAEMA